MFNNNFYSFLFILFATIFISSCAHSVKYEPSRTSSKPRPINQKVIVYEEGESVPDDAIILGKLKLGESGLSFSCGYNDALYLAKKKAKEVGADAIQIIKVKSPDFWSSCYRLELYLLELKK